MYVRYLCCCCCCCSCWSRNGIWMPSIVANIAFIIRYFVFHSISLFLCFFIVCHIYSRLISMNFYAVAVSFPLLFFSFSLSFSFCISSWLWPEYYKLLLLLSLLLFCAYVFFSALAVVFFTFAFVESLVIYSLGSFLV